MVVVCMAWQLLLHSEIHAAPFHGFIRTSILPQAMFEHVNEYDSDLKHITRALILAYKAQQAT